MAEDETIISVLKGDNEIVKRMGLVHPDIGRALFHVWNTGWMMGILEGVNQLNKIYYNDKEIDINIPGSRGWQESIFNDEILGSGHIEIESPLTKKELDYLKNNYNHLSEEEFQELTHFLSSISTGDMVPFYVMRYGFYEGHTGYRVDPLAVAFIFGLKSIEGLHKATDGDIYKYINTHFTINPKLRISTNPSHQTSGEPVPIHQETQGANEMLSGEPDLIHREIQGANIDSLVYALKSSGRNWDIPAEELISIGEDAVPALVELLLNRNEEQWGRRVAAMTLNQIRSPQTLKPGLKLLFDREDEWIVRNQIIPSLRGFDLSEVGTELWGLFQDSENAFHSGNIAALLVTSDTALAYQAYLNIYKTTKSHTQVNALHNLVLLRPHESGQWYIDALQNEDWMTGKQAMDSIINLQIIDTESLINLFNNPDVREEIRWRVTRIIKQRDTPESKKFIQNARKSSSWLVRVEANLVGVQ